jgi:hypothetical protein
MHQHVLKVGVSVVLAGAVVPIVTVVRQECGGDLVRRLLPRRRCQLI